MHRHVDQLPCLQGNPGGFDVLISVRTFLCVLLLVALSACSDPPADDPPAPCGGACPVENCIADTCVGGQDAGPDVDANDDGDADGGEDAPNDTDPDLPEPDADVPCQADDACPDGLICVDRVCREGCRRAEDCPQGLQCDPETLECFAACVDDEGCGAPEFRAVCDDGRCVDVACVVDDHCDPGSWCAGEGAATTCEEGCRVDDCPDGQFCDLESRACVVGCVSDDGCALGTWCDVGAAICRDGCREDVECEGEQVCARFEGEAFEERRCLTSCAADPDCPDSMFCTQTLTERGVCVDGCRGEPDNCPPGQACDVESRLCLDDPCRNHGDCEDGMRCDEGACVFGCGSDAACLDGAACAETGLCTCGGELGCADGQCFDGLCRQPCEEDAECPGICHPEASVCVDSCGSDADCPGADNVCADFCQPRSCLADTDCEEDANFCGDGLCAPGCRVDGCEPGTFCDLDSRACLTGCNDDLNCAQGAYCDLGECVEGCRTDLECNDGEVCVLVLVDEDLERQRCQVPTCLVDEDCAEDQFCGLDEETQRLICQIGCRVDPDSCEEPSTCDPETRTCSALGCRVDEECGFGQLCDLAEPTPVCVLGCRGDADCEPDFACVEETRQCTCANSDHCPGDGVCDAGLCVAPCVDDDECPGGRCNLDTRVCEVPCADDDDCDGDLVCSEGQCVGATCADDGECGVGSYCDEVFERCMPGCRLGACPEGMSCHRELRECVAGCRADLDCEDGTFCDPVDDTCRDGCRGDDECPEGQVCAEVVRDFTERVCAPAPCAEDADCDPNAYCGVDPDLELRTCVDGCRTSPDNCDEGSVCDPINRGCRVAGCEGDDACGDGRLCIDDLCQAGCREDGDCALACDDGINQCTCRDRDDCGGGLVCRASLCVEPCAADDECPVGEICPPDGECRVGCRGDDECEDPERQLQCQEALLVCEGILCLRDSDCGGAQYCNRALPQPRCEDGCRELDCPLGFSCSLETRECIQGCREDADCLPNSWCAVDTCRVGCREDGDCEIGQECVEREVDGQLEHLCVQPTCDEDGDCAPAEYCAVDDEEPRCAFGCRAGNCPENSYCDLDARDCVEGCAVDEHCSDGEYCELEVGECRAGCRADDDCGEREVCEVIFFEGERAQACLPPACDGDGDCLDDEFCLVGAFDDRNVCTPGCRVDPDNCPEDRVCDPEVRQCQEQGCAEDSDCSVEEICSEPFGFQCRVGCRVNDDCVDGGVCDIQLEQCLCQDDADCLDGTRCDAGACVRACEQDVDCGPFERCLQPEGVCFAGCRDDAMEPNDDAFSAVPLQPGTHMFHMCYFGPPPEFAQDCFRVPLDAGSRAASIQFSHAQGDLNLRVYDGGFTELGFSGGQADVETVEFTADADGEFIVCVEPGGVDPIESDYTLVVQ